jgi:hypothetical protein
MLSKDYEQIFQYEVMRSKFTRVNIFLSLREICFQFFIHFAKLSKKWMRLKKEKAINTLKKIAIKNININ